MSKVVLVPCAHTDDVDAFERHVATLWQAADLGALVQRHDLTAIKLHVGEPGCTTFARPAVARGLVRCVSGAGASPYLTDSAVLYKSPRDTAVGHARVAHEHGFGIAEVGAPFLPADGLRGDAEIEIPVGGKHFDTVNIASGILEARSLIVLSHATGHLGSGLGATLKNLGMGCAAKKGKLRQHHGQQPRIDPEECVACGTCAAWCPADAITVEEAAEIDGEACLGCGECVAVCREGAVVFDWEIGGRELQERIVEHAAGVVRSMLGRIGYVTVAQTITKDCDCIGEAQTPVVEDIGLLAGHDPVALDQAVVDLVAERAGRRFEDLAYPEHDASIQLAYAEELGLGSREYELVTVESS